MILQAGNGRPAVAQNQTDGLLDPELRRLIRLCDPLLPVGLRLTFDPTPASHIASEFARWLEEIFAPILLPHSLAAIDHARLGAAREWQATDVQLDAALPSDARTRSRHTGGILLRALAASRGSGLVRRIAVAAERGETPAHFATVHGLQTAMFHVPTRPALLSAIYFEWRAAGAEDDAAFTQAVLPFLPALAAHLQPIANDCACEVAAG